MEDDEKIEEVFFFAGFLKITFEIFEISQNNFLRTSGANKYEFWEKEKLLSQKFEKLFLDYDFCPGTRFQIPLAWNIQKIMENHEKSWKIMKNHEKWWKIRPRETAESAGERGRALESAGERGRDRESLFVSFARVKELERIT